MAASLDNVKARFSEVVAGMSTRDRRLLLGLIVFFALLLLVGVGMGARSLLTAKQDEVAEREAALADIQLLAAQQQASAGDLAAIDQRLQQAGSQDLKSFLEKTAKDLGVYDNLQNVRDREITVEDDLEMKEYTVELSKVSVEQFVTFLHQIETGDFPVRVSSVRTKTVTSQGSKVLNVTLELIAYHLASADAAPAGE